MTNLNCFVIIQLAFKYILTMNVVYEIHTKIKFIYAMLTFYFLKTSDKNLITS